MPLLRISRNEDGTDALSLRPLEENKIEKRLNGHS